MGPLKETGGRHECLSDRLWFGFRTANVNEGTHEQRPGCDSGDTLCELEDDVSCLSICLV